MDSVQQKIARVLSKNNVLEKLNQHGLTDVIMKAMEQYGDERVEFFKLYLSTKDETDLRKWAVEQASGSTARAEDILKFVQGEKAQVNGGKDFFEKEKDRWWFEQWHKLDSLEPPKTPEPEPKVIDNYTHLKFRTPESLSELKEGMMVQFLEGNSHPPKWEWMEVTSEMFRGRDKAAGAFSTGRIGLLTDPENLRWIRIFVDETTSDCK